MTNVVATTVTAPTDAGPSAPGLPWQFRHPLQTYGLSRLLTLVVAAVAGLAGNDHSIVRFLTQWDAEWFLAVVRDGYPAHVPEVAGRVAPSTIPFFPLFPLVTKSVSWLLPVSDAVAGILVSLAFGAICAVLLHRLVTLVATPAQADRAVALFSFFPASMVLSMPYSEGLMLALAAGCLLALLQSRWWLAGLCAALATACRATALALVLACLWQAAVAIRQRGEWRALIAAVLAPTGTAAFFAFLWWRTGEPLAYLHAEKAWGVQPGFGQATRQFLARFVVSPFDSELVTFAGVTVIFAVITAVVLLRRRWPCMLSVYSFSIVLLSVASRSDGLRPRDLLAGFPLILALGAATEGRRFRMTTAAFAGSLVIFLMFHNLGIWAQP